MNKQPKELTAEELKKITGGLTPLSAASLPSLAARSDLYAYFREQENDRISGAIGHWRARRRPLG